MDGNIKYLPNQVLFEHFILFFRKIIISAFVLNTARFNEFHMKTVALFLP